MESHFFPRALMLLCLGLLSGPLVSPGHSATPLVGFDGIWTYDQSGTNPATNWNQPDFDDTAWPSGPGLLGFEFASVYPEPIGTSLTVGLGQIAYYFRTHFTFDGDPQHTLLVASNYIDDGAVFYLNGREVARVRMPAGIPAFNTLATAAAPEGSLDVFQIPPGLLLEGDNVVAVEVHQVNVTSTDVMFGLSLVAFETNAPPPDGCAPTPSGLAAWWPLNGNGDDVLGANPFSFSGQLMFAPGKVGSAFNFGGVQESAEAASSAALNVGTEAGMTIEGWIIPADVSQPHPIMEWNDHAGNLGVFLQLSGGSTGSLVANLVDTQGGDHQIRTDGQVVHAGQWQHVALTYDKGSGQTALYLNGVAVAQTNLGSFTPQTSYALHLGWRPSGPFSGNHFDGGMDEISLYRRALTGAEILSIHNAGGAGKCPPLQAPVITSQPQNQSVNTGNTAFFQVVAEGSSPLHYQWLRNNILLPGQTNNFLVLSNVQTTLAGTFSVRVTNVAGVTFSSNATLTVTTPGVAPMILSQPQSVVAAPGNTVTFDVAATGTPPLVYRWRRGVATIRISTNSALVLTNVSATNQGTYSVLITNSFGSALSSNATLTVQTSGAPPSIVSILPASQIVPAGSNAAFIVTATGSAPLRYQWQFGVSNLFGRTNAILTISGAQAANAGDYRCLVANAFGSVTSSFVTLAVTNPPISSAPAIVSPVSVVVLTSSTTSNTSLTLSVVANGTAPLGYHWFFNGPTQPIPGASNSVLTLSNIQPAQAGTYTVVVSNQFGTATNRGWVVNKTDNTVLAGFINFTMTPMLTNVFIFDAPNSTNRVPAGAAILAQLYAAPLGEALQPLGGTGAFGTPGRITAGSRRILGVTNGQPVQVQVRAWEARAGASFEQALANGGRIGRSMIFQMIPQYTANGLGATMNGLQSFALDAGLAPQIIQQPQSLVTTQGLNVALSVIADGSGPLTYQWFHNAVPWVGANSSTLALPMVEPGQGGLYSVLVTNLFGAVSSVEVELTVVVPNRPPVAEPSEVTVQEDGSVTVDLLAYDRNDDDVLTYHVNSPAHGTLLALSGVVTYTPEANYFGPDSFTFRVHDGQAYSEFATVSITVTPVPDQPVPMVVVSPQAIIDSTSTNRVVLSPNGSNATVVLDASLSTDADNEPLEFLWFFGGASDSYREGASMTNVFGLGAQSVLLLVLDGSGSYSLTSVPFEVVSASEAVEQLIFLIEESSLRRFQKRFLISSLNMARNSFDLGHLAMGADQLRAFLNKLRGPVTQNHPMLTAELRRLTHVILEVIDP